VQVCTFGVGSARKNECMEGAASRKKLGFGPIETTK